MNPNDEIRWQILRWFYDRNAKATSQHGKKGSAVKISDVKRGMKEAFGLTQPQVVSNLTYLIDKGWINKTDIEKTVRVRGGTVPSTVTWYEISSGGIDRIEGPSEFQQGPRYAGINIKAVGTNIITLGDGNIVNARFEQLHHALGDLQKEMLSSENLSDVQKLDSIADIESIRDQLAKPSPDRNVIERLWNRVEEVATVGGFVETVARIGTILGGLF